MRWSASAMLVLLAFGFSTGALANEFQCNKDQSVCFTMRRDLTTGDQFAILNSRGEAVARGVVEFVRQNGRRVLKIEQRTREIRSSDRIVLLNEPDAGAVREGSLVEAPTHPDMVAGGGIGIGSINVDEGTPTYIVEGYGDKRFAGGAHYGAAAALYIARGFVSRTTAEVGIETQDFAVTALALMPTASYKFLEDDRLSGRVDVGLGFAYVSASVGGSSSAVKGAGYDTKMSNGFGLAYRLRGSALYHFEKWQGELALAYQVLHGAPVVGATIGLVKPIGGGKN